MHDLNFFRNNLDSVSDRLAARGFQVDTAAFQELDRKRRAALTESEQLKQVRNAASIEISKLRKEGVDTTDRQQQMRAIGENISALDAEAAKLDDEFRDLLARIPNIPHESVPAGKSAEDNVEEKRWG